MTQELRNSIEELNNYFIAQIITKNYTVEEINQYTVVLNVDDEFIFTLWIANEAEHLGCYTSRQNFMLLKFEQEDVKELLFNRFQELKDDAWKAERVKQLKEELEQLNK